MPASRRKSTGKKGKKSVQKPMASTTRGVKRAHCFTCKMNVDIMNSERFTAANNRTMTRGQCSKCGRNVSTTAS
jgi:hypothetical protein